ncbi:hypothetical protein os4_20670 [Comamonadaceae bacterium OS-4]|nr:hypothetical protein os4_20670 [Comamonadaceae bacterium OS-4]
MLKRSLKFSIRSNQSGTTLIEILVSILLVSFGLLAMAGMQAYSLAAQKNAANRAIGSMLANELAELIRLNQTAFAAGKYDVSKLTDAALPAAANCAYPACNTTDVVAAADLADFLKLVRNQLPSGGVELSRPGGSTSQADLWIVWEEASVLNLTKSGTVTSTEINTDSCSENAKKIDPLPRCFYMKVQL